jgi:hypothetical protein
MIPAGPLFHKPKSFISAKNLLYTSICIGFFTLLLHKLAPGVLNGGVLTGLLLIALGYVMLYFIIKQLSLCKEWARPALIIACVLIAAFYLFTFKMEVKASMAEWAFFVLQAVFELMAVIFLYTKESNHWFNSSTTHELP